MLSQIKDCFWTISYKSHYIKGHSVRTYDGKHREQITVLFRHDPDIDHYTQYPCRTLAGAKRKITKLIMESDK